MAAQTCKACGRRDKLDFTVPDDVWQAVVPPALQNRVVCLACFDDYAKVEGIDYATHIHEIWFAGDQATFLFHPIARVTISAE